MTFQPTPRFLFAIALASILLALSLWPHERSPADRPKHEILRGSKFDGTLNGTSQQPDTWTANFTILPETQSAFVTASWHRNGPAITLSVILPNGTRLPGQIPGKFPFTYVNFSAPHPGVLQVVLSSEVREAFEVTLDQEL